MRMISYWPSFCLSLTGNCEHGTILLSFLPFLSFAYDPKIVNQHILYKNSFYILHGGMVRV